jgi:prevent-host-death family protein
MALLNFGSPLFSALCASRRSKEGPNLTRSKSATKVAQMRIELVTTLKRRATELIADLRKERTPILITEYGKPAAYLVDAESFHEMNRKISVLEGLALGEKAVREGRVVSQAEARKRLARWLA